MFMVASGLRNSCASTARNSLAHLFQRQQGLAVLLFEFSDRGARLARQQRVHPLVDFRRGKLVALARQRYLQRHDRATFGRRGQLQVVDQPTGPGDTGDAGDAGDALELLADPHALRHRLAVGDARAVVGDLHDQRLAPARRRFRVEQERRGAFASVLHGVAGNLRDRGDQPGALQRLQTEQLADLAGPLADSGQAVACDLHHDQSMSHQFPLATKTVASSVSRAWSRNSTEAIRAGCLCSNPG
jgi:hypothetical protein